MNLGKIELSREVLSTSKVAKLFPENDKPMASMTSISFSDTGEYCVTSGADDSLNVYNCKEGT
jgi:COMPASS component SWD2